MDISSNQAHMLRLCASELLSSHSAEKFHLKSQIHAAENYIPIEQTRTILAQLEFLGEVCHKGHRWYSLVKPLNFSWKGIEYCIGSVGNARPSELFPFTYANGSSQSSVDDLTNWLGLPLNLIQKPSSFFRQQEKSQIISNLEKFEFFCVSPKKSPKECWIKYDKSPDK